MCLRFGVCHLVWGRTRHKIQFKKMKHATYTLVNNLKTSLHCMLWVRLPVQYSKLLLRKKRTMRASTPAVSCSLAQGAVNSQ